MIEEGVKVKIMIVVPNYWGKGDSIDEAWKKVREFSHRNLRELKSGPHIIYVVYDKGEQRSQLDEFGMNISYPEGYRPVVIHRRDE